MKYFYLLLAIILVSGFALTHFLIASNVQEAHTYIRQGEYQEFIKVLEDQLASGNTSLEILAPLVKASYLVGDTQRASELIEQAGNKLTKTSEYEEILLKIYFDNFEFEKIKAFESKSAGAVQLVKMRIAELRGDAAAEIQILRQINSAGTASDSNLARLAVLQCSQMNYDDCLTSLTEISKRDAESVAYLSDSLELFARLSLLRSGRADERLKIKDFVLSKQSSKQRQEILWQLMGLNASDIASDIVLTLDDHTIVEDQYLDAALAALRASGRSALSYDLLLRLVKSKKLPEKYLQSFVSASLESKSGSIALFELSERGEAKLSTEASKALAYALLEKWEDKARALKLFQFHAENAGPYDENVKRLFFLWGPRPQPESIAWAEARLVSRPPSERAGWLRALSNMGAGNKAAQISADRKYYKDPILAVVYIDLLESLGDKEKLSNLLSEMAVLDNSGQKRLVAAFRALNMQREAVKALDQILMTDPNQEELSLLRALYYCESNQSAQARIILEKFLQSDSLSLDMLESKDVKLLSRSDIMRGHYCLGAVLKKEKQLDSAKSHFNSAFAICQQVEKECKQNGLYPQLLAETKGLSAAIEYLRSEKGLDAANSKLLATLLIEDGKPKEALEVLKLNRKEK